MNILKQFQMWQFSHARGKLYRQYEQTPEQMARVALLMSVFGRDWSAVAESFQAREKTAIELAKTLETME